MKAKKRYNLFKQVYFGGVEIPPYEFPDYAYLPVDCDIEDIASELADFGEFDSACVTCASDYIYYVYNQQNDSFEVYQQDFDEQIFKFMPT